MTKPTKICWFFNKIYFLVIVSFLPLSSNVAYLQQIISPPEIQRKFIFLFIWRVFTFQPLGTSPLEHQMPFYFVLWFSSFTMRLPSVLRFVNRLYLVFSHKYTVSKGFGVLLLLVSHHSIGMAIFILF
jgi:hypothetical protein